MRNKLISIIFPSRVRLDLVDKLLFSLQQKTNNHELIEVIAICDHDDKPTLDFFHEISFKLKYDFKFISRKQNEHLHLPIDYYSLGLRLSSPSSYFTWILGNDCEMITENWDLSLVELLKSPDVLSNIENNLKYYYIQISDNTHLSKDGEISWDSSCCFPILSRNYVDDFGEIVPIDLPTWGGDVVLWNIVNKLEKFEIKNLTKKIEINHHTYHRQTYMRDENCIRMERYGYGLDIPHITKIALQKKIDFLEK